MYNQKTSFNNTQKQNKPERRCVYCDSKLHVIKECPHYDNKNMMDMSKRNNSQTVYRRNQLEFTKQWQ